MFYIQDLVQYEFKIVFIISYRTALVDVFQSSNKFDLISRLIFFLLNLIGC